jgi:hypothetical protein
MRQGNHELWCQIRHYKFIRLNKQRRVLTPLTNSPLESVTRENIMNKSILFLFRFNCIRILRYRRCRENSNSPRVGVVGGSTTEHYNRIKDMIAV